MRLIVQDNVSTQSKWLAEYLIGQIKFYESTKSRRKIVIGLPTDVFAGHVYDELVKFYKFEASLTELGGLDLLLTVVGSSHHIGGNEPGSSFFSRARMKKIAHETRVQLAETHFRGNGSLSPQKVPEYKLTMGLQTMFESKEIIAIFHSVHRAAALQQCVESCINHMCPASYFLHRHTNVLCVCDIDATMNLKTGLVKYFTGLQHAAHLTEYRPHT